MQQIQTVVYLSEITTRPPCTDSGVWILDGIVSCDYLEKPSGYGIHNNPAGFCQQHHKECCKTCNKLKQVNVIKFGRTDLLTAGNETDINTEYIPIRRAIFMTKKRSR